MEDLLDEIKVESQNDERVNNLVYQKEQLENQIHEQINHMTQFKNNLHIVESEIIPKHNGENVD